MKTTQFLSLTEQIKLSPNKYLYEGLSKDDQHSVLLWESAGRKIAEATLTADQIQQIFQQIQTSKGNRTVLGKGKDVGTAVAAAYKDLKNKVINSGPMQSADALYDQAAEKLKQATGGDQGVMQYVQKYRDFAKKHPIAQSFIYAALIAAAGISGAGAGGAAALGLLKMTDKLLQGEKFSKAAVAGAETGAMAYAAGQIGKAIRGDQAPAGTGGGDQIAARWAQEQEQVSKHLLKYYTPADFQYVPSGVNDLAVIDKATGQIVQTIGLDGMGPGVDAETFIAQLGKYGKAATSAASKAARDASDAAFNAAYPNFESRKPKSVALTEAQIIAVFNRVERINNKMIAEGRLFEAAKPKANANTTEPGSVTPQTAQSTQPADADAQSPATNAEQPAQPKQGLMSKVGGALGKGLGAVAKGAAKVGRSLTAKVSSDRLTKAWQDAGSPTDSVEIEKLLQAQGVNPEVVSTVFQANNIPVTIKPAPAPQDDETPAVFTPGGNRNADSSTATTPSSTPAQTTAGAATPSTSVPSQSAPATAATSTTPSTSAPSTASATTPAAPAPITYQVIKQALPTMKMSDIRNIKREVDKYVAIADAKRKSATPAAPAPAAAVDIPKTVPDTSSQNATTAALRARQAQGLGAYESLDYNNFKKQLKEARAK